LPHLHINFKNEKEGIKTPWHKNHLLTFSDYPAQYPFPRLQSWSFWSVHARFDGATIGGQLALALG